MVTIIVLVILYRSNGMVFKSLWERGKETLRISGRRLVGNLFQEDAPYSLFNSHIILEISPDFCAVFSTRTKMYHGISKAIVTAVI